MSLIKKKSNQKTQVKTHFCQIMWAPTEKREKKFEVNGCQ